MITDIFHIEEVIFYFLNTKRNTLLNLVLPLFSKASFIYLYYFILAIFLGFLWYRKSILSWKKFFILVSILIVGFLVSDFSCARIWKPVFHRGRPYTQLPNVYYYNKGKFIFLEEPLKDKKTLSFPSCHASNASFASTYLSLFMKSFTLPSFLFVFLVCYSRIYLGHHYPLDVLCGMLWGIFLAWVIYRYAKKVLV
ncbi:MAG: phosphatase PAP2 family protein [Caldimicrobium sp.]